MEAVDLTMTFLAELNNRDAKCSISLLRRIPKSPVWFKITRLSQGGAFVYCTIWWLIPASSFLLRGVK